VGGRERRAQIRQSGWLVCRSRRRRRRCCFGQKVFERWPPQTAARFRHWRRKHVNNTTRAAAPAHWANKTCGQPAASDCDGS
jgi:hypothetical protein